MKKEDYKLINIVSNLKNSIYKDTKYKKIQKEVAKKQKQLQVPKRCATNPKRCANIQNATGKKPKHRAKFQIDSCKN